MSWNQRMQMTSMNIWKGGAQTRDMTKRTRGLLNGMAKDGRFELPLIEWGVDNPKIRPHVCFCPATWHWRHGRSMWWQATSISSPGVSTQPRKTVCRKSCTWDRHSRVKSCVWMGDWLHWACTEVAASSVQPGSSWHTKTLSLTRHRQNVHHRGTHWTPLPRHPPMIFIIKMQVSRQSP